MKILLATGIYPPAIGGIATYAQKLAEGLQMLGHDVSIVTYSKEEIFSERHSIYSISTRGGIFCRWFRYARMLRREGKDADYVIALSSISAGVPLLLARLQKPKKILRLGGDFFWERYTDAGGMRTLRNWYASGFGFWKLLNGLCMGRILRSFNFIVYSSRFQQDLHEKYYALPPHVVIENATALQKTAQITHAKHHPLRLLFLGRFVGFKNLFSLVDAMQFLPDVHLTIAGDGPMKNQLQTCIQKSHVKMPIKFLPTVHGEEKKKLFQEHDLLIIPSLTEISPNVALEANAVGLPVLLTEETGYTPSALMNIRPLRTSEQIASAVLEYIQAPVQFSSAIAKRDWDTVAQEWVTLLSSL